MNKCARVFVSYAHESEEFKLIVKDFITDLKRSKIAEIISDVDYPHIAPVEGWHTWMHNNIKDCDRVIIICSPTYKRRMEKKEEIGIGRGVVYEGAIITNELYDSSLRTTKYVPILPNEGCEDDIPDILKTWYNQLRFPKDNEIISRFVCNPTKTNSNADSDELSDSNADSGERTNEGLLGILVGITAIAWAGVTEYQKYRYIKKVTPLNDDGVDLMNSSNFSEALDKFNKALAIYPDCTQALFNKGVALLNLGMYLDSVYCFDNVLRIDKSFEGANNNKGIALLRMGKLEESLFYFRKEPIDKPSFVTALINTGLVLFDLGCYESSLDEFTKALAVEKNNAMAQYMKARILNRLNRENEALQILVDLIASDQDNSNYFYERGYSLYKLRRYEQAIISVKKSIDITDNVDSHYLLSCIYSESRERAQALIHIGVVVNNEYKYVEKYQHEEIFEWLSSDIQSIIQGICLMSK